MEIILFRGLSLEEKEAALSALHAVQRSYEKGAVILSAGETVRHLCVVLSGSVTIESNDYWGNRTILSHIGPGEIFAETYALLPDEPLLVDAVANADCRILFLLVSELKPSEGWQGKVLTNLLMLSARKNLMLSGRSFHTAPKTIRERVMAYLQAMALRCDSSAFDIPYDRQQLADYLNVERSALSKELGRMQRDGLIRCRKSHFEILY